VDKTFIKNSFKKNDNEENCELFFLYIRKKQLVFRGIQVKKNQNVGRTGRKKKQLFLLTSGVIIIVI